MKSPKMEHNLNELAKVMFGRSRATAKIEHTCVVCGKEANTFRDAISAREYTLSMMCQVCQDKTFGRGVVE